MTTKQLKFNYIQVENFMSYRSARLDLLDKGLCLVNGYNKANKKSNGSGKSALITDALTYALFGETIRKIPVGKISNRFTKEQCSVEVSFTINDTTYLVKRCRRPDSLSFTNDKVSDVDKDKALGDSRDTNKVIVDTLGMGFDEFINSILFGQNIQKYFFLLGDAKQKDMLDSIIDIGIIDKYKEDAKTLKEQAETAYSMKDRQVKEFEAMMTGCTQRLRDYDEKEILFLQSQNKQYESAIAELGLKIRTIESAIASEETKLRVIDTAVHAAQKDKEFKMVDGVGRITALINTVQHTLSKKGSLPLSGNELVLIHPNDVRTEADVLRDKENIQMAIRENYSKISVKDATIQLYTDKVNAVANLHNVDCPTCGRVVDDSCVGAVKQAFQILIDSEYVEKGKLQHEIDVYTLAIKTLQEVLSDRENQKLYQSIIEAETTLSQYSSMKEVLSAQLGEIRAALKLINDDISFNNSITTEIVKLRSSLNEHNKQLTALINSMNNQKADNPYVELKRKEQELLVQYSANISTLQREMDLVTRMVEASKYWLKAFGDKDGIKSYIYAKVFPYLNERCNHYLSLLSNSEIKAEINLDDKDRFIVKTENSVGADVYGGNSGGEKRRIDMAVMFALHDLVASRKYKSNILILDEIFDNLDTSGIDSAMTLLHDIEDSYDSIFVISHTDMQEYFDNHLYIVKEGNTSSVVESLED